MAGEALTLDYAPPMPGCTICAHAWHETADGGEYVDDDAPGALGCAYLRTPNDEAGVWPGDFDIPAERDFPTFAEAEQFASDYAVRHGVPVNIY
jgi:hypothetical protein